MIKYAFLHTNNALAPLPEQPEEKKTVPTITTAPSKGQKSNPLKYSDVPAEIKQRYRKLSTKDLGRLVERSGGAMSPKGRSYAAVLEERSVNPMLAGSNPNLARSTPYSVHKTAQFNAAVGVLDKIAMQAPTDPYQNPANLHGAKAPDMTKIDNRVAGGLGGTAGGALLGGVGGLMVPGKGKLLNVGRVIGGTVAGGVAGGIYGATKKPVDSSGGI